LLVGRLTVSGRKLIGSGRSKSMTSATVTYVQVDVVLPSWKLCWIRIVRYGGWERTRIVGECVCERGNESIRVRLKRRNSVRV